MAALLALGGCSGQEAPSPDLSPAPGQGLYAGVAAGELDLPVGVPQSGYSARYARIPLLSLVLGGGGIRLPDDRVSPYADGFFPSIGMLTRPNAKCLALELRKGPITDRILFCRVELAFVTDILRLRVLEILQELTGADLEDNLLLSATHTHSVGARYWRLPYFSDLGSDTFHPEIYERLAWSIARTVSAALGSLEPARMGAGIWKGFDPRDELFRDRRTENHDLDLLDNRHPWQVDAAGILVPDGQADGKVKDDQLSILRVDHREGGPMALLFHFPVHCTTFPQSNLFMSSDTSGAIEHQVELSFSSPMMAMHIQGTAGDMEPGLVAGHPPLLLERQGRMAAERILALHREISTQGAPAGFLCSTRHVSQGYERLGYPGAPAPYSDFDAPFGAAQCGVVFPDNPYYCLSRPNMHLPPGGLSPVVGDVVSHFLCEWFEACTEDWAEQVITGLNPDGPPYEQPPELFHSTVAVALLQGVPRVRYTREEGVQALGPADLLLVGLPGEPTTPLGFQTKGALARDLQQAGYRTGPEEVLIWGFTQDYFGYLLTPEDWLAGGYEISINLWGPFWGSHVASAARDLARRLVSGVRPAPTPDPRYTPVEVQPVTPQSSSPPEITAEPSDTPIFSTAVCDWKGGDPAVDSPAVLLERESRDGAFEPVLLENGLPYNDAGPEIALLYRDHNLWSAYWEVPWNFPAGTYRLVLQGAVYTGAGKTGGLSPPFFRSVPYLLITRPFRVRPAGPFPFQNARWSPGSLSARVSYPPATFDADPNTPDGLRWRPGCPEEITGRLRVTPASSPDGPPVHEEERTFLLETGCRIRETIGPSFTPADHRLELSFQDPWGNRFQGELP
jgi:neutral ceramidase